MKKRANYLSVILHLGVLLTSVNLNAMTAQDTFEIGPNDVPDDCNREVLQTYSENDFVKTEPMLDLRQAICLYLHSEFGKSGIATEGGKTGVQYYDVGIEQGELALNDKIIALLTRAQNRLPERIRSFAALLQGIVHCRQGTNYLVKYQTAKEEYKQTAIENFCLHRGAAYGNITSIDVGFMDFEFSDYLRSPPPILGEAIASTTTEEGSGNKLDKPTNIPTNFLDQGDILISKLSQCYTKNGILNRNFDSKCTDFSQESDTSKEKVVMAAVDEVMDYYFATKGPITAMLNRQKDSVKEIEDHGKQTVAAVNGKFQKNVDRLTGLKDAYDAYMEKLMPDPVVSYENSFSTIFGINDWFQRWNEGLMISASGTNYGTTLKQNHKVLALTMRNDSVLDKEIDDFSSNLDKLINRAASWRKGTEHLCRLFYCEYTVDVETKKEKFTKFCRITTNADTPICMLGKTYQLKNDTGSVISQKSIKEICQAVGFTKYAKRNLKDDEAEECWLAAKEEVLNVIKE